MLEMLGRWEIRTNPSKLPGYESIRVYQFEPEPREAADLEALAGDFITRHVLERDSMLFEG
jgi:hypothetical protein